jgi:hypothetical protein
VTHAAEDGTCTSLLAYSGHASCPASLGKRGSVPSPRPLAGTARPGRAQVFRFAADLAWRRQGAEVQVLEGNLRRVIGAEASGGELRAVQAGHALVRALLARGLPAAGGAGGPAGRGPSRPAGTRHRPVSRSRRSRSGPRSSRSCLMPGIIRCPESTAIQAGNPDHRGRGEEPGVSACSAGLGFGFRVGVVNARTASSSSRSAFPLRDWSRGCGGCGRMPAGGSEFAAPAGDLRYGGPAGIAARMLAASPAGMPAVLALPRGIAVAAAWPAGGLARGRFAGGRLMTEAWSCGGPGQVAGRGGCRWRGRGAWRPGPALPGRRRGTLDSVRIRSDPRRMRAPGPGRPGGRSSGFWQGGTGCA